MLNKQLETATYYKKLKVDHRTKKDKALNSMPATLIGSLLRIAYTKMAEFSAELKFALSKG